MKQIFFIATFVVLFMAIENHKSIYDIPYDEIKLKLESSGQVLESD